MDVMDVHSYLSHSVSTNLRIIRIDEKGLKTVRILYEDRSIWSIRLEVSVSVYRCMRTMHGYW